MVQWSPLSLPDQHLCPSMVQYDVCGCSPCYHRISVFVIPLARGGHGCRPWGLEEGAYFLKELSPVTISRASGRTEDDARRRILFLFAGPVEKFKICPPGLGLAKAKAKLKLGYWNTSKIESNVSTIPRGARSQKTPSQERCHVPSAEIGSESTSFKFIR